MLTLPSGLDLLTHLQPRKIRVGVLDFGDGRHYLQRPLEPVNRQFREQLIRPAAKPADSRWCLATT